MYKNFLFFVKLFLLIHLHHDLYHNHNNLYYTAFIFACYRIRIFWWGLQLSHLLLSYHPIHLSIKKYKILDLIIFYFVTSIKHSQTPYECLYYLFPKSIIWPPLTKVYWILYFLKTGLKFSPKNRKKLYKSYHLHSIT